MSLNKKDEDDAGIVKVDRTSVFQEGTAMRSDRFPSPPPNGSR